MFNTVVWIGTKHQHFYILVEVCLEECLDAIIKAGLELRVKHLQDPRACSSKCFLDQNFAIGEILLYNNQGGDI